MELPNDHTFFLYIAAILFHMRAVSSGQQ